MRLIDGDALIAEYDRIHVGPPGKARKLIEDAPTIEPEREKGEWNDGYKRQTCSVCKQRGYRSWNFCPNCGADMRKEGEQDG